MGRVLVTGAAGFIGRNLCATLGQDKDVRVLQYDVENSSEDLADYVQEADFVFHLAGVNRPPQAEDFDKGNRQFTGELLSLLERTGRRIPLVMTSSIQAVLDNPYGRSKRAAEEAVFEWSSRTGTPAYIYRLPNVFGKWCKPNYNSVVATFCYNIARGLPIQINDPTTELNLVYIDDVVTELLAAMQGSACRDADGFCRVPRVFQVTLQQLADTLYRFAQSRVDLLLPNLEGDFERFLYATYVSYLPENTLGHPLMLKRDARGWLAEFIKSRQFGQVFISRTKPGITRGNHWHNTKVEKFLVIAGEAVIRLRRVGSDQVIEYQVSGESPRVVDIPPGYTHSISNTGTSELITLFWADEVFDADQPDTYRLEV